MVKGSCVSRGDKMAIRSTICFVLLSSFSTPALAEMNPDTAFDSCLGRDLKKYPENAGPVVFVGQQIVTAENGFQFITNPTEIEIRALGGSYLIVDTPQNELALMNALRTLIAGRYYAYGVIFEDRTELVVAVGGETITCERFLLPARYD